MRHEVGAAFKKARPIARISANPPTSLTSPLPRAARHAHLVCGNLLVGLSLGLLEAGDLVLLGLGDDLGRVLLRLKQLLDARVRLGCRVHGGEGRVSRGCEVRATLARRGGSWICNSPTVTPPSTLTPSLPFCFFGWLATGRACTRSTTPVSRGTRQQTRPGRARQLGRRVARAALTRSRPPPSQVATMAQAGATLQNYNNDLVRCTLPHPAAQCVAIHLLCGRMAVL